MPDLTGQLTALAVACGLILPWVALAVAVFADHPLGQRLAIGVTGGLAGTITAAHLLASWGLFDLFAPVFAVFAAATGLLFVGPFRSSITGKTKHRDETSADVGWGRGERAWFGLCFALVLLFEATPTLSTDVPLGWDPSFHSILAKKILDSGRLSEDWLPFSDIPVNYPQGIHVLTAVISKWSGQQVHQVLQIMHLLFQPLAAVLVYLLARTITGEWRTAVLAMAAYAFLFDFGSFNSYFQWGGFPTELGSLFFLALVWLSLETVTGNGGTRRWPGDLVRVLLFGSMVLVHHLTALIGAAVILFFLLASAFCRGPALLRRSLLRLMVITGAAYSFYIVPYVLRIGSLGETETLLFRDEALNTAGQIIAKLGATACIFAAIGFASTLRKGGGDRQDFLLAWLTGLVAGFCLFDYVYRFSSIWLYGENISAFTPSRWMTVMSYPLSIYAGSGLAGLHGALRRVAGNRVRLKFDFALAVLVTAIAGAAIPGVADLSARRSLEQGVFQSVRKIGESTPDNAFIVYTREALEEIGPMEWVPYLTWRPSPYVPIPASEDRRQERAKRRLFATGNYTEIAAWLRQRGLVGYLLSANSGEFHLAKMSR